MIPPFDETGCLPPGVHPATPADVENRFGRQSQLRRVQMESVRWMVDLAIRPGVRRILKYAHVLAGRRVWFCQAGGG